MNNKKEEIKKETLDLIYNEVKEALDTQLQTVDGHNTKTSVIIGCVGVILGIALNLTYFNYLFFIGLSFLLLSFLLSLYSFKIVGYRRDPNPKSLWDKYSTEDKETIKKQLIYNFIESHNENEENINKKTKYINASLCFLFAGLILLTLSIL